MLYEITQNVIIMLSAIFGRFTVMQNRRKYTSRKKIKNTIMVLIHHRL